jgi:hypothetical protein
MGDQESITASYRVPPATCAEPSFQSVALRYLMQRMFDFPAPSGSEARRVSRQVRESTRVGASRTLLAVHTNSADRTDSCRATTPSSWAVIWVIGTFILSTFAGTAYSGGPPLPGATVPGAPIYFVPSSSNKSMLEARTGYLWGVNALWLRDGDNFNNPPGKREVTLESPVFGIQGETRWLSDDLGIRVQGWINLPQTSTGDFFLDRHRDAAGNPIGPLIAQSWESELRYLAADIAAVYHLGPFGRYPNHLGGIGMPYSAALTAGYRYINFDVASSRHAAPTGQAEDHMHIHIPYLGVHYANEDFMGTLVRLDLLASPLTMSRVDADSQFSGEFTEMDGQSTTGFWFETFFSWSLPVGERGFLGLFTQYDYLELSGGATVKWTGGDALKSTRFSLDSISHLIVLGASGVVTF